MDMPAGCVTVCAVHLPVAQHHQLLLALVPTTHPTTPAPLVVALFAFLVHCAIGAADQLLRSASLAGAPDSGCVIGFRRRSEVAELHVVPLALAPSAKHEQVPACTHRGV